MRKESLVERLSSGDHSKTLISSSWSAGLEFLHTNLKKEICMDILRTFLDNGNFKLVGQEGILLFFLVMSHHH